MTSTSSRRAQGARRGFVAAACALVCVLLASSPGVSDAAFSATAVSPPHGGPVGKAITLATPPAPTVKSLLGALCSVGGGLSVGVNISWPAPPAGTSYTLYDSSGNKISGPTQTAGTYQVLIGALVSYRLRVTLGANWYQDGPVSCVGQ